MKKQVCSANSQQNIIVRNILRSLGLNLSLKGSILIIKAVQIVSADNTDFIVINDIYKILAKEYKEYKEFNEKQIQMNIKYALDNRYEQKSIKNFELIFGFEYDEYIFTNKCIIEEIVNKLKNII